MLKTEIATRGRGRGAGARADDRLSVIAGGALLGDDWFRALAAVALDARRRGRGQHP